MHPVETASRTLPRLERVEHLIDQVERVFHGRRDTVRLALVTLLARGHLLVEDVPGVGKTTLARGLARALGLDFQRVQFTADLLPSDVVGVAVFNPHTATFETRQGPIFAHVLLADEINRAPPRTQSGLLQAMQERQATIDGRTLPLPEPFLVLATQNPFESHGAYPLPESQLDRFLMRITIGYPDPEAERRILLEGGAVEDRLAQLQPILDRQEVLDLQQRVEDVHVAEDISSYLLEIVRRTRSHPAIALGASPRAAVGLLAAARAWALVDGRDFVVPEDVRHLAVPCLSHRILGSGGLPGVDREAVSGLEEILTAVPAPL
ncbi:MAG: MoxR family ATPase [Gemmatimonadota bacterium]|nr:MoxR family ATPase [Gemmatimonadota bacterium]